MRVALKKHIASQHISNQTLSKILNQNLHTNHTKASINLNMLTPGEEAFLLVYYGLDTNSEQHFTNLVNFITKHETDLINSHKIDRHQLLFKYKNGYMPKDAVIELIAEITKTPISDVYSVFLQHVLPIRTAWEITDKYLSFENAKETAEALGLNYVKFQGLRRGLIPTEPEAEILAECFKEARAISENSIETVKKLYGSANFQKSRRSAGSRTFQKTPQMLQNASEETPNIISYESIQSPQNEPESLLFNDYKFMLQGMLFKSKTISFKCFQDLDSVQNPKDLFLWLTAYQPDLTIEDIKEIIQVYYNVDGDNTEIGEPFNYV